MVYVVVRYSTPGLATVYAKEERALGAVMEWNGYHALDIAADRNVSPTIFVLDSYGVKIGAVIPTCVR